MGDIAPIEKMLKIFQGKFSEITNLRDYSADIGSYTRFDLYNSALTSFAKLFEACKHIPQVIVTYNNLSGISIEQIVALAETYGRNVKVEECIHRHKARTENKPTKRTEYVIDCRLPDEAYAEAVRNNQIEPESLDTSNLTASVEYYKQDNVTLINGDATNPNTFREPFIDLTVTSPPYNLSIGYDKTNDNLSYEDYLEFSKKWMTNLYNRTKHQGRFALNVPTDVKLNGHHPISSDLITIAQEIGWKFHSVISWDKHNVSSRTSWGSFMSASAPNTVSPIENIIIFYKGKWKKTCGSRISDITRKEFKDWTYALWSITGESNKRIGHPAPYPRELARRCIKMFSFVDDVIFDPFSGSGTTLIEAQLNNRKGVGLEKSEKYCELTKQRILNECFAEKRAA